MGGDGGHEVDIADDCGQELAGSVGWRDRPVELSWGLRDCNLP